MARAGWFERLLGAACPGCRGPEVRRSHRATMRDDALALAGLRTYRCSACGTRYHALPVLHWLGRRPWAGPPLRELARTMTPGELAVKHDVLRVTRRVTAAVLATVVVTLLFRLLLRGV
jgi:hypothetical protein